MDNVKGVAKAAVEAVAGAARETIATVAETVAAATTAPLPDDRASLLVLHREARRRRDAAPLMSEDRAEAAYEIERIEIQIARIERAMDLRSSDGIVLSAGGSDPEPATGERVRIYEVGPRDGLQNEASAIPLEAKVEYVERLVAAGLREIEATSFVSPKAIPQLADADALLPRLPSTPGIRYPVLVPNGRGMARAEAAGADALAVFTAATDAFTERNIGMTVEESLAAFEPVLKRASALGWWRRGYVSTAFGCPYTGAVDPHRAVDVAERLLALGVDEVCFADTIGVGVPAQVAVLTGAAVHAGIALDRIAYHFHDTRGTALANVQAGLDAGVRCFDSSTGGTGGCPYAPGAAGNLATEDLVYLLDASGFHHGVRLEGVLDAARFIATALGRPLASKVGQAGGWDAATGARTGRD